MNDPLSFLPMALAAAGGRLDDYEASRLVAAGITMLQRSAPLVRALAGRRSAILLRDGPAFLTALAASDGRAALVIDPAVESDDLAGQLARNDVGAVLTDAALASHLHSLMPRVLLDEAPRSAFVMIGDQHRTIDLGTHFGLSLEGERDTPGSAEDVVIISGTSTTTGRTEHVGWTHRDIMSRARMMIEANAVSRADHVLTLLPFSTLDGLVAGFAAPLLAGAVVTTQRQFSASSTLDLIATRVVTLLVASSAHYVELLQQIELRHDFSRNALRRCISYGAPVESTLRERWHELTGLELQPQTSGYDLQ